MAKWEVSIFGTYQVEAETDDDAVSAALKLAIEDATAEPIEEDEEEK